MKSKAIIFDIDGTAVNSPESRFPSDSLISQIERLKDRYHFSAATGRVWSFAKHVLKALDLVDPCIISAGTQICDPQTGKILWQKALSHKSMREVIEVLKNYPEYKILFNDFVEDDYFHGGISPKDFKQQDLIYFFEQAFVPHSIAEEIYDKLLKIPDITPILVVAQKPGCNDIHVVNDDATKEQAVAQLLEIISIKKENTIGIGDGNNDIHLFNAVNHKVAMGNAVDALKAEADEIIEGIKEDGMAKYLVTL